MPYALDRLVDRSDDALLAEIRRVAALVDHEVLSIRRFREHSRAAHYAYQRRFGSWQQSLIRAGLGHRYGGPPVTYKLRRHSARRLSNDELLELLRRVARPDGVVSIEEVERDSPVSGTTYRARFGSWAEAVRRAGLRLSRRANVYDERACLENLRVLWTHYGRAPRLEEAARPPSTVGPAAYQRRWRGWNRALAAFVEWANAREAGTGQPASTDKPPRGRQPKAPTNKICPPAPPCADAPSMSPPSPRRRGLGGGGSSDTGGCKPAPRWNPEDRRHIPMGLRFQVLERDDFRCVACGDSPAMTRGCKLHVDHIEPWSQGGQSVAGNLRTLCAACNYGKGARVNPLPSATTPAASRGPGEGGARKRAG